MDEHVDRMTLVRIRGTLIFTHVQSSVNDFAIISWGFAKHQSNNAADLIDLSPSAFVDQDNEDWLYRGSTILSQAHGGSNGSRMYSEVEVDVKAQRVLEGQNLVLLWAEISASSVLSSDPVLYRNLRCLVKLA